ncbi:probable 2-oxoglutarate-dependent dioxygenase AOP1 [Coffea arabica]|uniref:Probable 2-oxoglutarate-dependent dioxygenase AOP1 n=1 Tax=Coffea arabica TaxID=13443 RepID=A0A6P6UWA1_COFAR
MDSETIKLPAIDFSQPGLKPGNPEWDSVKGQVRKALEEFGCFEAMYDKISLELQKSFFKALEELFNLPLQTKQRNASKKIYHGYIGQYPIFPLYESMGLDDANILEKVESFTDLLWPEGNSNFCKTVHSYSEQISELDKIVRRMILESLGLEKYMDEHMELTNCLLRAMKYEGPQTTETKVGLPAHTDKNILSILCQDQIRGLQVLTKDGHWIDVEPSPGSFTVMIGDALFAWTNGRLHCPFHRVMMTGNIARYSAGIFSMPKAGYIIKAPEELVDEEHPLLFKPFDNVEFLSFLRTEAGKGAQFALKTYSGI